MNRFAIFAILAVILALGSAKTRLQQTDPCQDIIDSYNFADNWLADEISSKLYFAAGRFTNNGDNCTYSGDLGFPTSTVNIYISADPAERNYFIEEINDPAADKYESYKGAWWNNGQEGSRIKVFAGNANNPGHITSATYDETTVDVIKQ